MHVTVIDRETRQPVFEGSPSEAFTWLGTGKVSLAARWFVLVLTFSLVGCLDATPAKSPGTPLCIAISECAPDMRGIYAPEGESLVLDDSTRCQAQLEVGWLWQRPGGDRIITDSMPPECSAAISNMQCPPSAGRIPPEIAAVLEACSVEVQK